MSSFVSSILHSSANKIESVSLLGSKKSKSKAKSNQQQTDLGSRLAMHASTPILSNNSRYYYHHPQRSYSTEYIPAPPPYDTQQQQLLQMHSPVPSPSTSWTSEMSAFAEKIKDDVTSSFKGGKKSVSTSQIDRYSISQGMKLVSIAADEYEQGNGSVALGIYLTGIDKILMALPNKTDINTKMAIREKLQSVEERVGIINLAAMQKNIQQNNQQNIQQNNQEDLSKNSMVNSFLLSRIASTISTFSTKAYQPTTTPIENDDSVVPVITVMPTLYIDQGDSMTKFKRFGQYMINITVTFAVLVKRSPLPDLLSFLFGYMFQLMLWVDSQYHIMQRAHNMSIQCLKFGLQANEQYRLHEFISEGLYIVFAAGLKATVAFNEAPAYDPKQSESVNFTAERIDQPKTCLPTVPQKAKSPWVWSPW